MPLNKNDRDTDFFVQFKSLSDKTLEKCLPKMVCETVNEIPDSVAIILGYYNGMKFLSEQISSILEQNHQNIEIYISDDSSDQAINFEKLNLTVENAQRVHVGVRSSNVGYAKNFIGALKSIEKDYNFYAFSDQDDVWNREKIRSALQKLEKSSPDRPFLYCARTTIMDENLQVNLGVSSLFKKPPSFPNSLVQNISGGNTMVFNKAARDLIIRSAPNAYFVAHDWWCYQIISGAGGIIYYDPIPCLKYRQHSENAWGANSNWRAKFIRMLILLKGRFRSWNDLNVASLLKNRALLTIENQKCLDDFNLARQSGLLKRLFFFKRAGIYRQTALGNFGLFIGALLNKV